MKKKEEFVSEAIDYKRDIEPYPIIQLYAGVGSGKNTFIEKLILGEIKGAPKGLNILMVTSRRAKVDETLTYYDGENSLKFSAIRLDWKEMCLSGDGMQKKGKHIRITCL